MLFFVSRRIITSEYEEKVEEIYGIENLFNVNNGFIYFGNSTCPYCQIFYPWLEKTTEEIDMNVAYVNTEKYSKSELEKIVQSYNLEYVPYLVKIEDKEVVERFEAYTDIDFENKEKTISRLKDFFHPND